MVWRRSSSIWDLIAFGDCGARLLYAVEIGVELDDLVEGDDTTFLLALYCSGVECPFCH